MEAQEHFSLTDQSRTIGTLLDYTHCNTPPDSGGTNSFMSKQNIISEINLCMGCLSLVKKSKTFRF